MIVWPASFENRGLGSTDGVPGSPSLASDWDSLRPLSTVGTRPRKILHAIQPTHRATKCPAQTAWGRQHDPVAQIDIRGETG